MKKIIFVSFLIVLCIVGLCYRYYYVTIQGGPTKKTLTINNFTVHYTHVISDNQYQMDKINGHAYNNMMTLGSAKIEIGKCLCDSYLSKKNSNSTELINICKSNVV